MLFARSQRFRFRVVFGAAVVTLLALFPMGGAVAVGDEYYVSPAGDDGWSGRLADANADRTDGPWRTLAKACAVVGPGDTCRLRAGVYRETLRPVRDGAPDAPIMFAVQPGERVLLTGSDPVGGWQAAEGGLFHTSLDWDLADENQLFAGERMLTEARWPDLQGTLLKPARAVVASGTANTIVDPNLPGEVDDYWKGAVLWCAGGERWYCWSASVTAFDAATKTLTFDKPQPDRWYTPRQGNLYVLMGVRNALDAEGEWWLDRGTKTLWLKPSGGADPNTLAVEAKRRIYAIDLSGRAHIHIDGIGFRAGGIATDAASHHLQLKGLNGQYIGHSYVNDVSGRASVLIKGHDIEVIGCEFAYASGSLIRIEGRDNRLINSFLHDGNYAGKWNGVASFSGRRHVISHNTIRDSGRDVCSVHGLMESLIQHNDLSHSGWLTADLGMTYGHNTDFMNTVIRYNWVHDNLAHGHTAGIYFDHCSHNAIVHHNIVWNVPGMPLQVNNPSYFMLCYNNTLWNSGRISTFDHSHRNDLFGSRFQNNIAAQEFRLPAHVATEPNLIGPEPGLADPRNGRFELAPDSPARGAGFPLPGIAEGTAGSPPDLGALPPAWQAGHNFENPPDVCLEVPLAAYSNAVRNAAFELGTLEYWTTSGPGTAGIAPGNGWGNGFGRGEVQKTGTSKYELKLNGRVRVQQTIAHLHPGTAYQLSGWLKVSGDNASAVLGVRGHGGQEVTVSSEDQGWERKTLDFTTGADVTSVTVFVEQTSEAGQAFADNLGLPRNPPSR